jgi:hypothetical protein
MVYATNMDRYVASGTAQLGSPHLVRAVVATSKSKNTELLEVVGRCGGLLSWGLGCILSGTGYKLELFPGTSSRPDQSSKVEQHTRSVTTRRPWNIDQVPSMKASLKLTHPSPLLSLRTTRDRCRHIIIIVHRQITFFATRWYIATQTNNVENHL